MGFITGMKIQNSLAVLLTAAWGLGAALAPALVGAQSANQPGGSAGSSVALSMPSGARALGLGNAGLMLPDPDAVFRNPGMLVTARGVSASVQRYGDSRLSGTATSVASVTTVGAFSVALGIQAARFSSSTVAGNAFSAGVARNWKGYRLGAVVKYAEDRAGASSDGSAAVDFGAARSLGPSVLSLSVQNIGSSLTISGESVELPRQLAAGWSMGPRPVAANWDLGAVAQLGVEGDDWFVRPAGGVEVAYVPIEGVAITARGGVRRPRGSVESAVTGGLSFALDWLTIDYALEPMRDGVPSSHRIGIRVR